jgi:hypothetical protein
VYVTVQVHTAGTEIVRRCETGLGLLYKHLILKFLLYILMGNSI